MCKPYPGPRCAAYRRTQLNRARQQLEEARTAGADSHQLQQLEQNVEKASRLYDATPSGQRELAALIHSSQSDPEQSVALRGRLDQAQQLQEQQRTRETEVRDRMIAEGENDERTAQSRGVPAGHNDHRDRVPRLPQGLGVEGGVAQGGASGDRGEVDGPEGRYGDQPRLLTLAGRTVTVRRTVSTPTTRAEALEARGRSTPDVYEIEGADSAAAFRDAISSLREGNEFAASVYVYSRDEYEDMRKFVTADGKAGFALHSDEIVSVFARRDSADRRPGRALTAIAIAEGGRRLDCYDTVLPELYAREGMVPVARIRWNDDYAPEDWDKVTFTDFNDGEPDVVFMAYDPTSIDRDYQPGAGEYVEDYDQAEAKINDFLGRTHP